MKYTGKILKNNIISLLMIFLLSPALCLADSQENKAIAVAVEDGSGPIEKMNETVDNILNLLNCEEVKKNGLTDEIKDKILKLIDSRFNFRLMSKLSLGQAWAKRSQAEQEEFIRLFSELLKQTYFKRIESYSNEKVIFSKQDINKDLATIYSLFVTNNTELSIIYKMKKYGDDWLVYDVIIEGASVIKQYRRQFSRIIEEEKYEGLRQRLEDKMKNIDFS